MSYARNIKEYIKSSSFVSPDEETAVFVEYFRKLFGEHLISVILYGSCIHPSMRKSTSIYDFYLILNRYRALKGAFLPLLNWILPPNVHYIEIQHGGKVLPAKYNTISLKDFERETSLSARDLFTLGRFGKFVKILYVKNGYEERILDSLYNAAITNGWYSLMLCEDEFTLEEFIIRVLALSYQGEVRIERDTKVQELFEAYKDYYLYVYGRVLEEFRIHIKAISRTNGKFIVKASEEEKARRKAILERFIKKSRRLSILRWPKSIYTFGNYVNYLIHKVERAKGIKIELTPLERRFPLIFGWRHFFKLRRKGMIK